METPEILYHASQNRDIETLEPRAETIRNKKEGPVVFASPDKAWVTMFLVPSDDSWTRKMRFNGKNVHVISDKERYLAADKGGSIYHLNPGAFSLGKDMGGARDEWISRLPVKPIHKEDFDSGLEAQIKNGVSVYFVDNNTFEQICTANDHGKTILSKFQPSTF